MLYLLKKKYTSLHCRIIRNKEEYFPDKSHGVFLLPDFRRDQSTTKMSLTFVLWQKSEILSRALPHSKMGKRKTFIWKKLAELPLVSQQEVLFILSAKYYLMGPLRRQVRCHALATQDKWGLSSVTCHMGTSFCLKTRGQQANGIHFRGSSYLTQI